MADEEFTIELRWRCKKVNAGKPCDHLNLGRDVKCAKCGWEKTVDCVDEMPTTEEEISAAKVTDPTVLATFALGETYVCSVCETDNRSTGKLEEDCCSRCGSPRTAVGVDRGKAEKVMGSGDFDEARAHADDADASDGPAPVDPFAEPKKVSHVFPTARGRVASRVDWRGPAVMAAVLSGVALTVLGLWWLLASHPVHTTISALHWERSITLEESVTRSGSGWGTPPVGSFNQSCQQRDTGRTRDCNAYNCRPHPAQRQVGSHQCRPHSVQRRTGSHKCNPHTSSRQCRPHDCNCSTSCTSGKNGSAKCRRSCSTCYDSCSTTEYDSCPDYETYTAYDSCPDYETYTAWDTCYLQCPVIEQHCDYQYNEWVTVDKKALAGDDEAAAWPALTTRAPGQRVESVEAYSVTFSDARGHSWRSVVSAQEFARYLRGQKWLIAVNAVGLVTPMHVE